MHEIASPILSTLLAMEFNTPENDQLALRQHANIKGKLDMVNKLLNYDHSVNEVYSEELQSRANAGQVIRGDGTVDSSSSDQPLF